MGQSLQATGYRLQQTTTGCGLQTSTDCGLQQNTGFRLQQATDYNRLQATDYRLQQTTTGYRLRATADNGLQSSDYKTPATGYGGFHPARLGVFAGFGPTHRIAVSDSRAPGRGGIRGGKTGGADSEPPKQSPST